jgi:shikimate dehydrogenase
MRAAVLGSPITHSLSPVLHNAGYQALGLDHHYEAIEVTESTFKNFVAGLTDDWMGLSLTMPLKVVATTVAEHVAPVAQLTGSINTLVNAKSLIGYNTDVYGIVQACAEFGAESAQRMTIIGSGATARSAIAAAFELGVTHINLIARNSEAIAHCDQIATELGITFSSPALDESHWLESDIVVNTTPSGVADAFTSNMVGVSGLLLDVVYHPWPTALASAWQQHGGVTCPGYIMLLHQAAAQFELFTDHEATLEAMREAMMQEFSLRP